MSSEGAAFQAAQQRHHHYMVFGKKQRYIEVFQCSGEDMNHVLTGGTTPGASTTAATGSNPIPVTSSASAASPAKDSTSVAAAAAAAAAATNGLLPPGMFTVPPATSQTPLGLDPNSAILAAAQAAQHAGQQAMQNPLLFPYPRQPQPNAEMFGMQLIPNLGGLRQAPAAAGLMAYNPAMAAAAAANPALLQMQMQQQLLQSQLAAQRFLLTPQQQQAGQHAGQQAAGLIGPQIPNKRSFDQAFQGSEEQGSKRTSYGTPTISAGPTTYSR